MHPSEKIIALRAKTDGSSGHMIQVLNLETKARVGTAQMTEPVVYWRWVGPKLLALVTDRAVYHWTVGENAGGGGDGGASSEPTKICSREGRLAESVQIISYSVDKDFKWCILTGISTQVTSSMLPLGASESEHGLRACTSGCSSRRGVLRTCSCCRFCERR